MAERETEVSSEAQLVQQVQQLRERLVVSGNGFVARPYANTMPTCESYS